MYDNIGEKIKGLAKVCWIIESIFCVIMGIFLMVNEIGGDSWIFFGPACIIGGPLSAWVSSWLLYGFGEMIDKLCAIERNTNVRNTGGQRDSTDNRVLQAFKRAAVAGTPKEKKTCPHCGEVVSARTCVMCGKTNPFFD